MELRVYEVLPDRVSNAWRLQRRGSSEMRRFTTRMEAIDRGTACCREMRPSQLVVRAADGRIQEQRMYSFTDT